MGRKPSAAAMPGALELKLVVGGYGVQGVGKSSLLVALGAERTEWKMVEGSEALVGAMTQVGRSIPCLRLSNPKVSSPSAFAGHQGSSGTLPAISI